MSASSERFAQLEARIAELEQRKPQGTLRLPSVGRRLLVVGVALALMIPTGVVLASHQFGDVPPSNQFHADIDALADSGITAGCGNGNYCPSGNVTREQMAGYLHRGLGRAARANESITFAQLLEGTPIAEVTLTTGGVPGGTGFVLVTASGSIQAIDEVCPCEVGMSIKRGAEISPLSTAVARTRLDTGWWLGDAALTWVFEVPSGTNQTFQLIPNGISWLGGSDESFAVGTITAVYLPFGSSGGSALSDASLQGTIAVPSLKEPAPEAPAKDN